MQKALWALAVVAAVALGTSIITATLDGSAQTKQSHQIATLEHEQSADHKELATLSNELHTKNAGARP